MSEAGQSVRDFFPAHLVDGYEAFVTGRFGGEQQRYRELAEGGQSPRVMLIGCCDSRVAPEAIFDAGPGEIFVVRNVANLVPPYAPDGHYHGTSSALEFGVMALRVEHIVVMGHAQCGGVSAFAQMETDPSHPPVSPGDFIGPWIKLIAPAAARIGKPDLPVSAEYVERLALESIKQSLANLRSFPCIGELEQRGKVKLHGAYFGVMDGRLLVYDAAGDRFVRVAGDLHAAALQTPRF
ncbi:MAG: Carbonic anhydrase [Hyphomicrobiales bacterium]|jgi:carbonic anhydrase|nr:Carbonic anhydrase [Hyphomicrobiales bacterium]